ncbi:MAG: hypothetical protein ACYT04_43390 [Nostoc sp.]
MTCNLCGYLLLLDRIWIAGVEDETIKPNIRINKAWGRITSVRLLLLWRVI